MKKLIILLCLSTLAYAGNALPSNVSGNGVFWVSNGIGFKAFKQMDIPLPIHKKLIKFLHNIPVKPILAQ